MAAYTENERKRVRVLGLGNEILADDAVGILAAREVERAFPRQVEVVCSSSAGFGLMEDMVGASRLLVIDSIVTGKAKPGTIHVLTAKDLRPVPGIAPHFVGLFEVLDVARQLYPEVPGEALAIAVEAADCTTVGGPLHPDVRSAIPAVVELVGRFLGGASRHDPASGGG